MATAQQLGAGGVNANGKPVFIANETCRYIPTVDRQLSDQEQLQWKSFQLYRASMSMERRDSVYQSIVGVDSSNLKVTNLVLGTPFPVIDASPSVYDCLATTRWYEHLFSIATTMGYGYWIRSKPSLRHANIRIMTREVIAMGNFCGCELLMAQRSLNRLTGEAPNEPECEYYGVMEDSTRLKEKARLWAKYAAYKEEWCRRWDYHVFGIRPGERMSFFSACFVPPKPVRYNTRTDFPMRKNPYFLSNTPLRNMFLENPFISEMPKGEKNYPLAQARPEVAFVYDGPDQTRQ
jgi:hypothetical protein